jgi:hypothetical protein
MKDDAWVVRLPSRIKPVIDELASEAFLPAPDYVRALVQRVVLDQQIKRRQREDQK